MKQLIELIRDIIAMPFYLLSILLFCCGIAFGLAANVIEGDYK